MNFRHLAAAALLPASLLALSACQQDSARPAATASATLAASSAARPAAAASASPDAMAALQQALEQRIPQLNGHILEVNPSPMPGLYEVLASGNNLFYTDAQGDFLLNGSMLETRTQNDLTAERIDQLNAIAFDQLPTQDAFVTKRGDGSRQLSVFSDPNCPFCHRLEESLAKIDNITIHTYLLPILGDNSVQRAGQVWCATDRGRLDAAQGRTGGSCCQLRHRCAGTQRRLCPAARHYRHAGADLCQWQACQRRNPDRGNRKTVGRKPISPIRAAHFTRRRAEFPPAGINLFDNQGFPAIDSLASAARQVQLAATRA